MSDIPRRIRVGMPSDPITWYITLIQYYCYFGPRMLFNLWLMILLPVLMSVLEQV